ncbi:hypothetical protein DID88_005532 [Monilinia fructigena]|uniref:C2 domain-containing protein n=1 Tax=Monilinia fructigena TaxID=38457 RepID=A0A395J5E0_9HELO|nr:hypothetical protein DID88_005532 [Monilinia fructigena]
MVRKLVPWLLLLIERRTYQIERRLGSKILIALLDWARKQKKTETDKRGGQTPRWDQELRFTVHDSPDYYQLKVSVFNDDKRTDLIGETWVNLQDVIVAGGGQSDVWHNLNFKGKYAGEIRVEITYYDKRPKPEKLERKEPKPSPSTITPSTSTQSITDFGSVSGSGSAREGVSGPRQLGVKPVVKRRPLPSDPITGAPAQPPVAAVAPAPAPVAAPPPADVTRTPPRGYQVPAAADHAQMTPNRGYRDSASAIPDHVQTPPRGYQNLPTSRPDHVQMSPNGMPDHIPRGYANPPVIQDQPLPRVYPVPGTVEPMQAQRGYHSPNVAPAHAQTPPRGYQNGFVPDQSSKRVEYNAPTTRYNQPNGYDVSQGSAPYGAPQDMMVAAPPSSQPMRNNDRYESYDPMSRNDYEQGRDINQYPPQEEDPRDRYGGPRMLTYEPQASDPYDLPMSPGPPPPPPPAHASKQVGSAPPLAQPKAVHGRPVSRGNSNPYNIPLDDMHRHSMPAYTQSTTAYQAYNPPKADDPFRRPGNEKTYQTRHNSYDSRDLRYNSSYEDMQPTVEDAPPTPAPGPGGYKALPHRASAPSPMQQQTAEMYDQVPAPLNLKNRPSGNSYSQNSVPSQRGRYQQSPRHQPQEIKQPIPLPYHDNSAVVPYSPQGAYNDHQSRYATSTAMVPVNTRGSSPNPAVNGRGASSNPPMDRRGASPNPMNRRGTSPNPPVDRRGASPNPPTDRRGASPNPPMARRGVSPNPAVVRKSVSPAPEPRSLAGSKSATSLSAAYESKDDADAKIITHDGREIDPSDHIPESNYAPLLEQKGPKYASQMPDRNYRDPPAAQPNGYQYGSSPGGGYRGNVGPAVPAKIPMALPLRLAVVVEVE